LDAVKPRQERSEFLRGLDLSETLPTIGLLPGSRGHELTMHVPLMVEVARIISRELHGAQFVVGAAGKSDKIRREIDAMLRAIPDAPVVRVAEGLTYECMAYSDLLISKSGTATVEAAILGTPMVIVYKGSPIMRFEFLFRKSVLEGYIGMPNILADREICPELINADASVETVAEIALGLLRDKDSMERMRSSLRELRAQLGEPGAVERAAKAVLEMGGLS
jgi:lipid-A-disaccharide synthase